MKLVNVLGDALRSTGTAIGGTVTYIAKKHGSGFDHEEGLSVRIDQFIGMHDAHKKWALDVKAYAEASRRYMAADALMEEGLAALSLHDFPSDGPTSHTLVQRTEEHKKISAALQEWNLGFKTIEDGSRDLVKEMDEMHSRIQEANKQQAELAFLKKKEKDTVEDNVAYDEMAKKLLEDILALMTKKDELLKKWLEKWSAMDARLHMLRGQVILSRTEEEDRQRKAEEEKRRLAEEKANKWREEKPAAPVVAIAEPKVNVEALNLAAVREEAPHVRANSPRAQSPRRAVPLPPPKALSEPTTSTAAKAIATSSAQRPKGTDETLDEEEEESDER